MSGNVQGAATGESSSTVAGQAGRARRPREVDVDSLCDDQANTPCKKRKGNGGCALTQSEDEDVPMADASTDIKGGATSASSSSNDGGPLATAATASGSHMYARKLSSFWSRSLQETMTTMYPLIAMPGTFQGEEHAPMLVLTRVPLPTAKNFSVFCKGFKSTVELALTEPLNLDKNQIDILLSFTARIARMLANKALDVSREKTAYLFAPLSPSFKMTPGSHRIPLQKYVQWDLAKAAGERFMEPVMPETGSAESIESRVEDAVIQDRWIEFTNRFFVVKVRHDLTPMSKATDNPRGEGYDNFVEYIKEHRKDFNGLRDYNQPMIEVSLIPSNENYLTPFAKAQTHSKSPVKYLVPELCARSTVPASTFRTALLLPSILRRVEDQLLTKELDETLLDNSISDNLLLHALSPPSACTEHDYQRLEFLGDTFLKYLVSTYCYVMMPTETPGYMHTARQHFISNKALLKGAVDVGLPPYIQGKPFAARLWTPLTLEDTVPPVATINVGPGHQNDIDERTKKGKRRKQREEQNIQWLGDKTIADVVEAIIGAAFETAGRELALKVTKNLTGHMKEVAQWSHFARFRMPSTPSPLSGFPMGTQAAVEKIIGTRFREPFFLAQALTHPSVWSQHRSLYERLEFLGDAVLDHLAVRYVYFRDPRLGPGALTLLRAAMVSNQALAAICVESGLYKHLRHSTIDLPRAIDTFAQELRAKRKLEHELAKKEGRDPGQYWAELDPPKTLADIVESTIGALFLSDGFSEIGVQTYFDIVLKPFYDKYIRLQTLSHHPNKTLYELFDSAGCHDHRLEKTVEEHDFRCDVIVHEVILASATRPSATLALRAASLSAIYALEGDPGFMGQTCDCRTKQLSKKAQKNRQAELGYEEEGENA